MILHFHQNLRSLEIQQLPSYRLLLCSVVVVVASAAADADEAGVAPGTAAFPDSDPDSFALQSPENSELPCLEVLVQVVRKPELQTRTRQM